MFQQHLTSNLIGYTLFWLMIAKRSWIIWLILLLDGRLWLARLFAQKNIGFLICLCLAHYSKNKHYDKVRNYSLPIQTKSRSEFCVHGIDFEVDFPILRDQEVYVLQ